MNSPAVVFAGEFLETGADLAGFSLWTSDEFGNHLEAQMTKAGERMIGAAKKETDAILRDLARAKVAFQLRAIEAVVCADARSKPDQETRPTPPSGASKGDV